jgi:hypothetical protein
LPERKGAILNRILLAWLLLWGAPLQLRAQQTPATTFEELRSSLKLKEGESIDVTEDNGSKYKARLAAITDRTLAITANGVRRDLMESQVREIRRRRPDRLWNGMLIGMGAGIAAAAVGVAGQCGANDSECTAITTAVFVPVFAGIGLGAGAAIDFAIRKHETVFARPGGGNSTINIAPILAGRTAGVRVLLSF